MDASSDRHPLPGAPAPDFRLRAAGGGERALSDYRGRGAVLLWFSKGLFCPYCRRNMARLSHGYGEIRARNAEVLQITHNTIEEANLYFRSYRLAMPYLCDADRAVHLRYGIPLEQQSIGAVADNVIKSSLMTVGDLLLHGEKSPLPVVPIMRMGARNQPPQLVVVVDRGGVVRWVRPIGPFDTLPTLADLTATLDALGAPAAAAESLTS